MKKTSTTFLRIGKYVYRLMDKPPAEIVSAERPVAPKETRYVSGRKGSLTDGTGSHLIIDTKSGIAGSWSGSKYRRSNPGNSHDVFSPEKAIEYLWKRGYRHFTFLKKVAGGKEPIGEWPPKSEETKISSHKTDVHVALNVNDAQMVLRGVGKGLAGLGKGLTSPDADTLSDLDAYIEDLGHLRDDLAEGLFKKKLK